MARRPTCAAWRWQRVEAYTAWRFAPRVVTWIVEGPGHWKPNLAPAVVSAVEIWDTMANAMVTSTLNASPYGGYDLPACGPYRLTATVGDITDRTVPLDFAEAVRRLTTYLAAKPGTAGVRSESIDAGSISISRTRSESWMASALQNSGAADLLRSYKEGLTMGILDLFRRSAPAVEQRSAGTGFTAEVMRFREAYISGRSGLGELTGTVSSCVSLWQNGLWLSDVTGTDLLGPCELALIGRSLALRGEIRRVD